MSTEGNKTISGPTGIQQEAGGWLVFDELVCVTRLTLHRVNRIIIEWRDRESNCGIERYLERAEVFVQQHIHRDDIVDVHYILGAKALELREDQVQCSEERRRIIGLGLLRVAES